VVNKHFKKILPLDIDKLGEKHRPVAAKLEYVIKPDVPRNSLYFLYMFSVNVNFVFK